MNLFQKIKHLRNQNKKQKIKNNRLKEQQVIEHEKQHAQSIKHLIERIEFYSKKDKNNIEYKEFGKIFVNSNTNDLADLKSLIKASEAPNNPSNQDRAFKKYLENRFNNLKRFKK